MMRTLAFWAQISLLGLTAACTYSDDDDDYYDDGYDDHGYDDPWQGSDGTCGTELERGIIDLDAPLASEPGEGVGLFVEYQEGGRWHLFTTCDSEASGYDCEFDIVVTPRQGAPILGVTPEDLERDDGLEIQAQDSARLLAYTALDTDGFYVDTDPGAVLEIDVLLDGQCGNGYVFWIGDGGIHSGAPSNPFELEPVAP